MIRALLPSSAGMLVFRTTIRTRSYFKSWNWGYRLLLQRFATHLPVLSNLCCRGVWARDSASFCCKSSSVSANSPFFMEQVPEENEVRQVKPLDAINDDHGGVIVEMNEPMDPKMFISELRFSISYWKQQGKKGVWIKLPIGLVNLVEAVVKEGFWYHHAEPTYLMLVYWIPEGAHTLPVNATHRLGVGAFVLNENKEVLVVQEKSGIFRGTGVWKFPTGVVDEGEDICKAAVREVREETGIDAEFIEVLAFRQSHKSFFGKSDLFFVCMLAPLSFEIHKQDEEIEEAQWMKFDEYSAQPFVQQHEVMKYINDVCAAKIEKQYSGLSPMLTSSAFSKDRNFMYLNVNDLNRE